MFKKICFGVLTFLFSICSFQLSQTGEMPSVSAYAFQPIVQNQDDYLMPLSETEQSWNQPVKPFKIIGNVYYVGASDVTSFLITTSSGHILIDSGFAQTVPQIKKNIAELGFKLEDIKILLNGHAHYDHCGGLADLKAATGAKFMAMAEDAELLQSGGKGDFYFGDKLTFKPVTADRRLNDKDTVTLGGITLTAYHTPGHTKGCTTWTMKASEGNRSYNVVFTGSASVPGYSLIDTPNYPNIISDYQRTFQVLKTLSCDVFLAQHASFFKLKRKLERTANHLGGNPFIDPQGLKNFIANSEKNFYAELKKQRAAKLSK
ncbi:MAG: subclass B3 metallo-beta-lactamase [Acidobacteriota bacterium]